MWDKHWADYLDDNSAGELVYLIQLEKELALLKHRADVELDLQMMELPECNDQLFAGLVDCVKGRGFVMYKHYDTLEAKKNAIKRIRNQTAPIKLQIQIKSREYTQYIEAKQAETVPESYITVMLIRLSDWKKYHIDEEKLTVKQFNIRVREYVKYVQENNRTL